MRKSIKEAAATREAIVAAAADHIRQAGIAGASLSDMMAAAGLTHGGFYRHFRNKEQLVAEALTQAGQNIASEFRRVGAEHGFNAAIDGYLSTAHRDAPTEVCPLVSIGSEAARLGGDTKDAAVKSLEVLLSALTEGQTDENTRNSAIIAISTMVGALTLARLAAGTPLSDEILDRAKGFLHR